MSTAKQYLTNIQFASTTNATDTSSGSVNILGGLSVQKDIYIAGNIYNTAGTFNVNTISSSSLVTSIGATIPSLLVSAGSFASITSGILNSNLGTFNTVSTGLLSGTTISSANAFISNNLFIGGTLTTVNITSTNLVDTNITATSIISNTNVSTTTMIATTYTGNNMMIVGSVGSNLMSTANLHVANTISSSVLLASGITVSNINFTGNLFQNGSVFTGNSQWTSGTGGNLFYTGGNVGINTTAPSFNLDVVGGARFTTGITTGAVNIVSTGSFSTLSGGNINVSNNLFLANNVNSAGNMLFSTTGTSITTNLKSVNNRMRLPRSVFSQLISNSSWQSRASPADSISQGFESVAWSPELSLMVAMTGSYGFTSPDGITWTSRVVRAGAASYVRWISELKLFLSSGSTQIATSPDGITWTTRLSSNTGSNPAIIWSPELSLMVSIGNGGSGFSRFWSSPNGITWTSRSGPNSGTSRYRTGCWSSELSLFVAMQDTDSTEFATSTDGITWVTRTKPLVGNIYQHSIVWSPELYMFVAVDYGGSSNNIITSSDGITWVTRTCAASSKTSVVWAPELSVFLTFGLTGSNLYSYDGISWYTYASINNYYWGSTWVPELGRFVAVGGDANTVANKILTSNIVLPHTKSALLVSPSYMSATDGNVVLNGNVTTATLLATTSISTGLINVANATSTNLVATNASISSLRVTNLTTATLIASTGATLGNLTVNTVNVTPSIGDISTEYWTQMANNTNGTVFGLAFSNSIVRSFFTNAHTVIIRTTGGNLYSKHELKGIQLQSGWMLNQTYIGDNTGITFGIDSNGQVYYTSSNIANYSQSNVHYRALVTSTTSGILI